MSSTVLGTGDIGESKIHEDHGPQKLCARECRGVNEQSQHSVRNTRGTT